MAVTGTCPLRNPSSAERRTWGSIRRAAVAHRQAGDGRRVFDGREALFGRVDDEEDRVGVVAGDGVDGDDGVDAAAEGEERTTRGGVEADRRRRCDVGTDHVQRREVEPVVVSELTEPVHVVAMQEGPLRRGRRKRTEIDDGCGRRLVIGDAGQEEEQAGGGHQRRIIPVTPGPEGKRFGEGGGVRRVRALDRPGDGVDGEAAVAELVGRWHR